MTTGLFFPTCALCFSILLNIVYFSKRRLKNVENKLYQFLVISNLFALLFEYACTFVSLNYITFFSDLVLKTYLLLLLIWIATFSIYMIYITKKDHQISKLFWIVAMITFAISILIFPITFAKGAYGPVITGVPVNLVYLASFIFISVWVIIAIFNKSFNFNKKIIPLMIYIILGIITSIVQNYVPGVLLITPSETLVTFLMYFTIENPDVKLIEELNIAKETAVRANNAKTEFLSNMSHEIRTPLNAIVGFSEALQEEEGIPETAKEDVKDIMMASQGLLEIVNGILDISKIEADKLEIVNTTYEPVKIFNELVVLTKGRLGNEKPIELRVKFSKDLPSSLYGDYARVKQIVLNLLTNAVKYTEKGYIDFVVESVILKNSICRLIISVEDTGIGIKRDNIDKLFQKFERADEERNITIEGTGLGLAITKKLVELMHGEMVVQSIYGKGSKFTVCIDQKIVDITPKKVVIPKEEVPVKRNYKGKRILVVDDNKLNLKVAERLLKDYGVFIDEVSSGMDAIKRVEMGVPYNLILMDDMMPEMSGSETLLRLKEKEDFKIKTVALTANAIAGMKEKYLSIGFDDYLSKPIQRNELERVLDKYLREEEQ